MGADGTTDRSSRRGRAAGRVRAGATAWAAAGAAALTLLLAAMPGCAVDQAKEVATYRAVLDAGSPPAPPFVPGQRLTLDDALLLANQHNELLGLRGEDYLRALIEKDRAASAFLPTISLAPSYFAQEKTGTGTVRPDDDEEEGPGGGGTGGGTGRSSSSRDERFDVAVNARANLFNGMSDLARYRAAGRTIEQRRALLLDAQAQVLLDVAVAYFRVLRAERLIEVLEGSLTLQEARLRDTRVRQQAGVAASLAVAQAEAQVSATRVSLINARNEAVNSRTALSLLTGVDVASSPLVEPPEMDERIPPLEEVLAEAMESRQDLAAARAQVEASRRLVEAAVGQYYPSVTLNLNYFLKRQSSPEEVDWNAVFNANLPIFSAGEIRADVRAAWSGFRSAVLSESLARRTVVRDVRVAYDDLVISGQRLAELAIELRAAEEAMRFADRLELAGRGTHLERLVAQDQLLSAQLESAAARFDHKVAHLVLLRATGRLSTRLPWEPTAAPPPATGPAATMPAATMPTTTMPTTTTTPSAATMPSSPSTPSTIPTTMDR